MLLLVIAGCGQNAAQSYAAAADASNAVYDTRPNLTTGTLDEWHAWGNRVIASNQTFTKALQAMSVDGQTANDVHALIGQLASDQTAASQIVAAGTVEQARLIYGLWPRSDAANLVRLDLGLPPAPISSP